MGQSHDVRPDGTVSFLPNRLNRHPVVVRGLTADELWICSGLSAVVGLAAGIALAFAFSTIAMVPTAIVLAISIGVFAGGDCFVARNAVDPIPGCTGRFSGGYYCATQAWPGMSVARCWSCAPVSGAFGERNREPLQE